MGTWPVPTSPVANPELVLIATTTLAAPAAAITFSGIDTSYRMFEAIAWMLKDGSAAQIYFSVNALNSGSFTITYALNTTLSRTGSSSGTMYVTQAAQVDANSVSALEIQIQKTAAAERISWQALMNFINGGDMWLNQVVGDHENGSNLISSISLNCTAGNFATGTRCSLGGAKVA